MHSSHKHWYCSAIIPLIINEFFVGIPPDDNITFYPVDALGSYLVGIIVKLKYAYVRIFFI